MEFLIYVQEVLVLFTLGNFFLESLAAKSDDLERDLEKIREKNFQRPTKMDLFNLFFLFNFGLNHLNNFINFLLNLKDIN